MFGSCDGMIAVSIRFTSSAAMRKFSAVSSMSPSASAAYGLPCSSESSRAKSSRRSSIRSAIAWQILARSHAESAAHFGCAARAAATARPTSSALASGASASVSPVTGETTARTLSPVERDPLAADEVLEGADRDRHGAPFCTLRLLKEFRSCLASLPPRLCPFSRRPARRARRGRAALLRGLLRDLRPRQRRRNRAGALPAPRAPHLLPGSKRAGDGAHRGRLRADEEPARDAGVHDLDRAGRDEPRHRRRPRDGQSPARAAAARETCSRRGGPTRCCSSSRCRRAATSP